MVLCILQNQLNSLELGCPSFFHNEPNYKFKCIRRAAKLLVYKISFFGLDTMTK